eukprot:1194877-Prorocentrum_minimum.AAC.4
MSVSSPNTGFHDGSLHEISAVDKHGSDQIWVVTSGFIQPSTLSLGDASDGCGAATEALKSLPAQFDAKGLQVAQGEATSKDGTKV